MKTYAVLLMLSQILLVRFVKCQLSSTREPWSSTEKHPWLPEPKVQTELPPPASYLWLYQNYRANYTGLTYAPRLTFNWIVFLVVPERNSGAVGNLITEKFILTNCRVANTIKSEEGLTGKTIVVFATHYLFETHLIKSTYNAYDVAGVRGFRNVIKRNVTVNPLCSPSRIDWDVSILEVDVPIFPLVPLLGIMPIAIDYEYREIRTWDFPDQGVPRYRRTTCWVGTFGRVSYNNPQPLDTDYYKVQYRVYPAPLTSCFYSLKFLCSGNEACNGSKYAELEISKARCFETRAKVGSVCDQDRGAPLACDGEVIAIVLRAAQWKFCNNLIHVPFFAQAMDTFGDYFAQAISDRLYSSLLTASRSEPVITIIPVYIIFASQVVHFALYLRFS